MSNRARVVAATLPLLVAACPAAHTDPEGPSTAAPDRAPAPSGPDPRAVYEGFTDAHPWRAVLARVGRWRLAPEEPWREPAPGREASVPFDLVVADARPDQVQVVGASEDMFYAAWVPREDLAAVALAPLALAPSPGDPPGEDEPGVRLAPGVPLERLEASGDWIRVRLSLPEVRAEGWVPGVLVGEVFREALFPTGDRVDREAAVGLELHDAAGGRVIAVLRPEASAAVRVRTLGEATTAVESAEAWVEVSLPGPTLRLRGFVPADGLAPVPAEVPAFPGYTLSSSRVRGDYRWLRIPIAQEVHLSPDGDVFAVASQGTKLVVRTDAERHPQATPVTVQTLWGEAPGWVECEPVPVGMPQPLIDSCVPPIVF